MTTKEFDVETFERLTNLTNKCAVLFNSSQQSYEYVCDLLQKIGNEKHRHYHTLEHIHTLYYKCIEDKYNIINIESKNKLLIFLYFAIFHDSVYDLNSSINEELSSNKWKTFCLEYGSGLSDHENEYINQSILDSKLDVNEDYFLKYKRSPMVVYDREGIIHNIENNTDIKNIIKEYQIYDWNEFEETHLKIANHVIGSLVHIVNFYDNYTFDEYVNMIKSLKPKRVGIYCGTFYPMHIGHLNIINKASKIFDKIIVSRMGNPDKINCIYSKSIIKEFGLSAKLSGTQVLVTYSSVFDLYEKYKEQYDEVVFIRGFRNSNDVEYDMAQTRAIEDFIEHNVVFIPCDREFTHISSSMIKKLESLQMDVSKYLV